MTHVTIALVFQLIVFLATGSPSAGGLLAAGFFIGREQDQAAKRYLAKHGLTYKNTNVFERTFSKDSWNKKSMVDWIAPVVAITFATSILSTI